MKPLSLFLLVLITSCSSQEIRKTDEGDFARTINYYQNLYIAGSENCNEILSMIDDSVDFNENGKSWTKSELKEFCPHLPKKNVFKTIADHMRITSDLGYDFVNQLILTSNRDTVSETTSRVWKKSGGAWKIVKMDVVRYQIVE